MALGLSLALIAAAVRAQDVGQTDREERDAATVDAIARYARGEHADAMPQLVFAAESGDARARYLVGLAHFNGDLLPRDWPRAYALVLLAAEAGLKPANGALARMAGYLSPDERSEGEALARFLAASAAVPDQTPVPAMGATASEAGPTLRLGAFRNAANAARLRERLGRHGILRGAHIELTQSGGMTLVSARGFAGLDAARRACEGLRREGVECLIIR